MPIKKKIPAKSVSTQPGSVSTPSKTFSAIKVGHSTDGERVLIYAENGLGKTTLASLAPEPFFIALDDGAKKKAGVTIIPGVETFEDLRGALQAPIWDEAKTVVIDTLTVAETLAKEHLVRMHSKDSFRKFGFDGISLLVDAMRLIQQDLDRYHVQQGRDCVLICYHTQIKVSNAAGVDFICDAPAIMHYNNESVMRSFVGWCDQVVRIGYYDTDVSMGLTRDGEKKRLGKATGTSERAIFTDPEPWFVAKRRELNCNGQDLPPVIPFDDKNDDSFWRYMNGDLVDDTDQDG